MNIHESAEDYLEAILVLRENGYIEMDADGFITLFGLPLKVRAMKMQELEKKNGK